MDLKATECDKVKDKGKDDSDTSKKDKLMVEPFDQESKISDKVKDVQMDKKQLTLMNLMLMATHKVTQIYVKKHLYLVMRVWVRECLFC